MENELIVEINFRGVNITPLGAASGLPIVVWDFDSAREKGKNEADRQCWQFSKSFAFPLYPADEDAVVLEKRDNKINVIKYPLGLTIRILDPASPEGVRYYRLANNPKIDVKLSFKQKTNGCKMYFSMSLFREFREAIRHIQPVFCFYYPRFIPSFRVYKDNRYEGGISIHTGADVQTAHEQVDIMTAFINGWLASKGKKWR